MKLKGRIRLFWLLFIGFLLSIVGLFVLVVQDYFGALPSIEELQNPSSLISSEIYSEDGVLLGKYYKKDRLSTRYEDISPFVIKALIATEDERFFYHSGIDIKAFARAVYGVITLNPKGGGSTISQQLALNLLTEIDQSNQRAKSKIQRAVQKLKEWVVAIKLEKNFTKEEILALYLNTVPFGDNIYGIKNAAGTFFQKSPRNLTLEEAAVLIGMLKGNTLYNPRKNPTRALNRRNVVIEQMYNNDFITYVNCVQAKKRPMIIRYLRLDEQAGMATYFREVVRDDVKNILKNIKKTDGTSYDIYKDGLKIYTTINSTAQEAAESAMREHLSKLQVFMDAQPAIKSGSIWKNKADILWNLAKQSERWQELEKAGYKEKEIKICFHQKVPMHVFTWSKNKQKDTLMSPLDSIQYHQKFLQNGFLAMDPNTGFVKAWVGGVDYKYFKYDHVNIHTKRQVGSSIKPLLYALAILDLGYNDRTLCPNTEQCFPEYDGWCSHNDNNTSSDNIPLSKALALSLNNVSAYLIKKITPRRFVEFLRTANIKSNLLAVPSICLGTPEISLYEMLWAYSMFPAKGYCVKPTYIMRIEDKNGNILKTFTTEKNYVIGNADAYLMTQLLKNVVDYGTAASMRFHFQVKGELAGKTGTTNNNSDAWFIGFTPNLVAGVWVGCDMPFLSITSNQGYGGKAAMPIFAKFMNKVAGKNISLDTASKNFVMPENYYQKLRYNNNMNDAVNPVLTPFKKENGDSVSTKKNYKNNKNKNLYLN